MFTGYCLGMAVAYRGHDFFHNCLRNHRHGPSRKHNSSVGIYGPLLSNGCCVFAYFAVVAQQWVYVPQYEDSVKTNERKCELKCHFYTGLYYIRTQID
jgi:hypothetical protein